MQMSPLLELASPPKKQAWAANRELARFGHWYSPDEERERETEGRREGGGERRRRKCLSTLLKSQPFVSSMVLWGIVCGCSVLETGERISKSRSWKQHQWDFESSPSQKPGVS